MVSSITRLLAMVAIAAGASSASAQTPFVKDVAWLEGCWEQRDGDRVVEERWTPPRAGSMLGVGRTTRGEALVEHEYVLLSERDGMLAYEAHPSAQMPAIFLARQASAREVVFENPDHDFPQRVGYRRTGDDALLAWIQGTSGGRTRRVEFAYRRVNCAAP